MAEKANHHYIPQFYLRGFSNGVGRKAKVFVFDSSTNKSFETLVRNVGSKRHFNKVEYVNADTNAIEDSLSGLESDMAPFLLEVIESRSFPSHDHFSYVMNLLALLSVRNPRFRKQMADFHIDVIERMTSLNLASKARWDEITENMKRDGAIGGDDIISYESMKKFHEEKDYDIEIDQTYLIDHEFKLIGPILEQLSRRSWCFISAQEGSQYISSDDPVTLIWTDSRPDQFYGPGHGLIGTSLYFPISSHVTLLGTFEPILEKEEYNPAQVAALNTVMARQSRNQIYARDGSFRMHLRDYRNVRGDEMSELLRRDSLKHKRPAG